MSQAVVSGKQIKQDNPMLQIIGKALLYIVLISRDGLLFYEVAGTCFMRLLATAIYPYVILWLGFQLHSKSKEDAAPVDDNSLIRFYDEYKKLINNMK